MPRCRKIPRLLGSSSPSFSAQELRQSLGGFGLAPLGSLRVLDHSLRPGLAYALAGVGLDRFDDRKLLRPTLPLGHKAILLETRGYGIPVQVWNTSIDFGGRSFSLPPGKRVSGHGRTGLLRREIGTAQAHADLPSLRQGRRI